MERREKIKASLLENLFVNWATPLDILNGYVNFYIFQDALTLEEKEYFRKKGIARSVLQQKNEDYQRLINVAYKKGFIPSKVKKLYSQENTCGMTMVWIYNLFRRPLAHPTSWRNVGIWRN